MQLRTERLLLREFAEGDWKALHAIKSRADVAQYQSFEPRTARREPRLRPGSRSREAAEPPAPPTIWQSTLPAKSRPIRPLRAEHHRLGFAKRTALVHLHPEQVEARLRPRSRAPGWNAGAHDLRPASQLGDCPQTEPGARAGEARDAAEAAVSATLDQRKGVAP